MSNLYTDARNTLSYMCPQGEHTFYCFRRRRRRRRRRGNKRWVIGGALIRLYEHILEKR
jgi:hypothetical protein